MPDHTLGNISARGTIARLHTERYRGEVKMPG